MKIFITGCAKSGTTLLYRLFNYFKDTEVFRHSEEDWIFSRNELKLVKLIEIESAKKILVGKRSSSSILSSKLLPVELKAQSKLILDNDIKIINIVRDGRDVILSDNHYVSVNRWMSCILQRETFGNIVVIEIKYEDLIYTPDVVQKNISEKLGLDIKYKFSDYPRYLLDEYFIDINQETFYKPRPIGPGSIHKDVNAYKDICTPKQVPLFEECLRKLEYIQ